MRLGSCARRWARAFTAVCLGAAVFTFSGCALILPQTEKLRQQWPAELAKQAELERVPFFPQKDYQCGPASLATVMADAGATVAPDDLVPKVYLPQRGGSLQIEMLAAPRSYGLMSWQLAPSMEDLLREVQAGTPVIVMQNYGTWPFNYWHYAVVIGFDREASKVVLRSGEKRRLEMPIGVLEYTWKDSGRWAMVAVPPDRVPVTAQEGSWMQSLVAMERVAGRPVARGAYEAALKRWPHSLNAAIGLANIRYAEGSLPAAEALLRDAVEQHPESTVALNNLAQVLADQRREKEALPLIDRAIALGGPFVAQAQDTRAQILRRIEAAH